jgi:hypothetical protein
MASADNTSRDRVVIWRYMDVAKYVTLLARGLFFARPSKFGDAWEGAWGVPDVRSFRENHADADLVTISAQWKSRYNSKSASLDGYGVSCWHRSEHESAALWSLYMPRGFGVAIRSTVEHVLASLKNSGRTVEPREVQYVDYENERLGDDPRDLLSYKRRSFAHESELRFVLALRDDEREAIDDWGMILTDRKKRHLSAGRFQSLVRPGPTPARVVTDPTLVRRATPHGVYLSVELPVLLQKVYLAPEAPWSVRHAVLAATEAFALPRTVVSEPEADMIPPDILEFQ